MTVRAPLTEIERAEMESELDLTRRIRAGYVIRLRREQLAGRSTDKLQTQVDACDRHIGYVEKALAE